MKPVGTILQVGNKTMKVGKNTAIILSKDARNKGVTIHCTSTCIPAQLQNDGSLIVLPGRLGKDVDNMLKDRIPFKEAFNIAYSNANNIKYV
jgi:hypothetical protein